MTGRGGLLKHSCDNVMTFCICASIFFLPIAPAPVEGFFIIMLLAHFFKRFVLFSENLKLFPDKNKLAIFLQSFKPQLSPLNKALGIYVLVAFLSVVFSVDHSLSLKGFVFKLLQGVYTYFIFIESVATRKRLNIFSMVFLASIALIVTNGMVQYFRGYDFIHGYTWWDGRLVSSFKHSNDFGAYLIVVIMFLLSCVYYFFPMLIGKKIQGEEYSKLYRFLSYILIIFLIGAIYSLGMTFSRGAWLGFFVAVCCFGIKRPKSFVFVPGFLIIIFLFLFYPMMQHSRNVSFTTDQVKYIPKMDEEASIPQEISQEQIIAGKNQQPVKERKCLLCEILPKTIVEMGSGRISFWEEAITIIRDYPVLGTGLNTYSLVAKDYKINWGGYPHNCYLQMAAEMGLLGLASFLWVIGVFIRMGIKKSRHASMDLFGYMAMGIFCGMIGFLVHAFFDTTFYSVQLDSYLWIMLGFFISTLLVAESDNSPKVSIKTS